MARKVVTADEMRDIERAAETAGISIESLMMSAGTAVADQLNPVRRHSKVLVLVGPGNNGGDGMIAADRLFERGYLVMVYAFPRRDPTGFRGMIYTADEDPDRSRLAKLTVESDVVIDALLGIGQSRPPEGELREILETVDRVRPPNALYLAVDIPTGVNADTGAVPTVAFKADSTVSFAFLKQGLVQYPGAAYAGDVDVVDVGIPQDLADPVSVSVPDPADIGAVLPGRSPESNKGTYGRMLFVGGSRQFVGAAALVAMAGYRSGAGLVELAVIDRVQTAASVLVPEAIFLPLPERDGRISPQAASRIEGALGQSKSLVFGPGLGQSDETLMVTKRVLELVAGANLPGAVFDADGLNNLAKAPNWWTSTARLVLTPHPGEMSRLTGLSVEEIQADRVAVARRFAGDWNKVVVLKGAGTVVASPEGRVSINPTGGPNLATAGTGDVLSGIIGSLIAQGCQPFDAAVAGTYLHGRAGDILRAKHGDAGTLAGDLPFQIPAARRSVAEEIKEGT